MIIIEFIFEDGTVKNISCTDFRGTRHKFDRTIKAVAIGLAKDTE